MEQVAPLGPVYQAGTLSGNPVAMAAGVAVLDVLSMGRPTPASRSWGAGSETVCAAPPSPPRCPAR